MSSIFSSKANVQIMSVSLVVILLGAVLLIAYAPWKEAEAVDNCLVGIAWSDYTPEQKRELPECEGNTGTGKDCENDPAKCNLPPEPVIAKMHIAEWVIVTTYTDGDKDVEELGAFELVPGAVIGGQKQKEILSWDIVLKYDMQGYAIKDVRIVNARMSFDSDVPSGDFELDFGFKNVPLTGPLLTFNGIDEPTISLDAFDDVEKPIVAELCTEGGKIKGIPSRDCEIAGSLIVGAQLLIDITDTKDEVTTLRVDFGTIRQQIVVTDERADKQDKPDWQYKCDFSGQYGDVPFGPYAHQYKVNKNQPYQALLYQAVSTACVKPVQQCDIEMNEIWNSDKQQCETIQCDLGERAAKAQCEPIECASGYVLWTSHEVDPKTFRGICLPLGIVPGPTECPVGEKPVPASGNGVEGFICHPIPPDLTPEQECQKLGHRWTGSVCLQRPTGCQWGMVQTATAWFCASPPLPPQCAAGSVLIGDSPFNWVCMYQCSQGSFTISRDTCPNAPEPQCDYDCGWIQTEPPMPPEVEGTCYGYDCLETGQQPEVVIYGVVQDPMLTASELQEVNYCADTNCEEVGITIVESGKEIETGYEEQYRTEVSIYTAEYISSPAVVMQSPIVCPSGYQRDGDICVVEGVDWKHEEYF